MKFTLDTNCLIDVDEEREGAAQVRQLLDSAKSGKIRVALVASSASERQKSGEFLSSFATFHERRKALGFGDLDFLLSIGRWGVSFFDHSVFGSTETIAREEQIYQALFPTSPYAWRDYASAKGLNKDERHGAGYARWRNQILDTQAFWAHEHADHDFFVTSDMRFKVLEGREGFPKAQVRTPAEAATLL